MIGIHDATTININWRHLQIAMQLQISTYFSFDYKCQVIMQNLPFAKNCTVIILPIEIYAKCVFLTATLARI
jgi:hypothetical protein